MEYSLVSPTNGAALRLVSEHFLDDGERLWPVVMGIPFLRPKEALRKALVADLQGAGEKSALRRLLADQDRFSPTKSPSPDNIDRVIEGEDLTLRRAMELLNFGPVGDYFAYRWCSPTFCGGLNMLESMPPQRPVIEVACGIGHYLRALETAGRVAVGIDIVFSKLWLARKFLGVRGTLVCGDVEAGPVIEVSVPTNVFCHDAFYFFEHKTAALAHMRRLSAGGSLAIGHVHTRRTRHAAGFALTVAEYAALTGADVRNDEEFITAWYGMAPPENQSPVAVGWVEDQSTRQAIDWAPTDVRLTPNPLLGPETVNWPSEGWREEYLEDSSSLNGTSLPALIAAPTPTDRLTQFRQRRLINLPQKW